ncbi:sirohydrochlorin cobaltochelatase [Fusobacterium perfoetens]|uniref:sirohydrochlorin cobaltochelatase n=1 Tax=Fusobacterium perfoetens TaxID=852 RepID=UPI0015A4D1A8|nr:sirohydrochlorin cobaltochelatase [Fusobacterium perfoetens]MCF2626074.1 sirohydrochlorin cobaltochelatase [Fusobacterium perfoetens]
MRKLFAALMLTAAISAAASGEEGGFVKSDFYKTMGKNDKASVLMVHFGTTFDDTRKNTIDAVNSEAEKEFPKMEVREAYTSRIIMRRLKDRGIVKDNPAEALDRLAAEGYTHIIVQPTNIINGVEAKTLEQQLDMYKDKFKEVRIGSALLTTPEDYKSVAEIINKETGKLADDEAVVLVGHGTHDSGNAAYPAMDYTAKSMGYKFYVGTVEGFPEFDDVVKGLKKDGIKKVVLMPFMFVAGDHANNDIAVDWKEALEKEGFTVKVKLTSLGMMEDIRKMFIEHAKFMLENKKEDMISKKLFYSTQKD